MNLLRGFRGAFVTLLALFGVCGGLSAQGAFRMAEFASEEDFKHEVSLSAGPAIPLGNTRNFLPGSTEFADLVPQGACFGGGVNASYRYYPLHQLYIGVTLFGQWYGYDYKQFDLASADRIEHSGWDVYGGAFELGTRLPLGVYGLYFTARFQVGYALMLSPMVQAIYSTQTVGDIVRPILDRSLTSNLYLGGGVGVQYRFRRHWIAHIGLDYNYMPSGNLGSDAPVRPVGNTKDLRLKLSSFVINVGVSYAF
ncbi:MAG: outer membrane beta-barrel protein [Bacteroides sp.]|nr:outer membrane beta-barrel protein [Bacteroides sp.]MCM1086018.1 outer membrane beta-barrel protein [Bacteroides sp.]